MEPAKKRRSSFAASFYSARPKSERSLRRSNGCIDYFEDEESKKQEQQVVPSPVEIDEQELPIGQKKQPINEPSEEEEAPQEETSRQKDNTESKPQ